MGRANRGVAVVLAGCFLLLALVYTPRPISVERLPSQQWAFPADLGAEAWPLTPGELAWLSSGGALAGERWRFNWHGARGSILFVTSDSWRAHHRPERCFEVYGLTVENSATVMAEADFPLRLLSLAESQGPGRYAAAYWFQSVEGVTDDYATRIWADLAPRRQAWILVTILFDEAYELDRGELNALYTELRTAVAASLEGNQR